MSKTVPDNMQDGRERLVATLRRRGAMAGGAASAPYAADNVVDPARVGAGDAPALAPDRSQPMTGQEPEQVAVRAVCDADGRIVYREAAAGEASAGEDGVFLIDRTMAYEPAAHPVHAQDNRAGDDTPPAHSPEPGAASPAEPGAPQSLSALIGDLPDDDTRVAQHQFCRERQAKFLNRLAACGSARSAVRSAGVSHQTAYRQRRACAAFRRAWDAALLIAREQAEEALACRAMEGVEEEVWFHGEVVGTRKRYDTRLLLAHLARLDRLGDRADVAMLAQDFDAVVAALEQGRDLPEAPVCERRFTADGGCTAGTPGVGRFTIRTV